jgi:hypothetical protein
MNKKGLTSIILIALVVVLAVTLGCVYLSKKIPATTTEQQPVSQNTTISATGNKSTAIESIDFLKYLAQKYESANPTKGEESCPIGSTKLWQSDYANKSVEYGYITENGVEDAVVNYITCWNGTGGGNSEVYTIDDNKNLINITPDPTKLSRADNEKFFSGFAGHGYFGISGSKLIFTYPVYKTGDSNASPTGGMATITFKWAGGKFIYDTILINPATY